MAGRVAGAMADVEGQLADRHRVAVDQPAVGLERLAGDAVARAVLLEPGDPEESSSCGPSIGTPSSSARIPADPQWSMWPWVSRIFSIVTPACAAAAFSRGEVAAGIDERAAHRLGAPQQGAILLQRRHRDDRRAGAGGSLIWPASSDRPSTAARPSSTRRPPRPGAARAAHCRRPAWRGSASLQPRRISSANSRG